MAKNRASTAKPRTRVRRPATAPATRAGEPVYGVSVPEAVHEAIEDERDNLGKLDSLLGCLAIALEHGRSDESKYDPYFPDLAVMARAMVQRIRNALDSVTISNLLLGNAPGGDAGRQKGEV